jgi:hypothetical protein
VLVNGEVEQLAGTEVNLSPTDKPVSSKVVRVDAQPQFYWRCRAVNICIMSDLRTALREFLTEFIHLYREHVSLEDKI